RSRTADLDEYLPGPRLGYRHVPELARLLPLDELESLDGAASVFDPVERDLEMLRAAEEWAPPVGRWVFDQPWVLDAADEALEREVDLQARQRTAHTAVDAAAPADVLIVLAFDVELLGIGEPDRVAVSSTVEQDDRRSRRDNGPAALDVGR